MFICHLPLLLGAVSLVALGVTGPGIVILALACGTGMPVMLRILPTGGDRR